MRFSPCIRSPRPTEVDDSQSSLWDSTRNISNVLHNLPPDSQFSLWDLSLLWSMCWTTLILLSILSMRFGDIGYARGVTVRLDSQFSLWDSEERLTEALDLILISQFSLWDSIRFRLLLVSKLYGLSILFVRFRERPRPRRSTRSTALNSLCEILTQGKKQRISLDDTLNSLCEIRGKTAERKSNPLQLSILFVRFRWEPRQAYGEKPWVALNSLCEILKRRWRGKKGGGNLSLNSLCEIPTS